jgi:hypothetical protein
MGMRRREREIQADAHDDSEAHSDESEHDTDAKQRIEHGRS